MKNIYKLALLIGLVVSGGCEKKLEIAPTFFSSEENALSSVDGLDAALSTSYSWVYGVLGTTFTLWSELMADHLYYQGTLANYSNYYKRDMNAIVSEQVSATDPRYVNNILLKQMYNGINAAALVIRGVEKGLADKDVAFAANRSRILGEAHYLRGVAYFETLRYWSKAWGATGDNSQPGLILNTEPVDDRVSQLKARASVAEVYAFVIEELSQAITLLPEAYDPSSATPSSNGRAYKDAARAYLAKVYFQQQNYTKAKEMIDVLLGSTAGTLTKHPLNSSLTVIFTTRGANNQDPENIVQVTASLDVNSLSGFWYNSSTAPFFGPAAATGLQSYASQAFLNDARYFGGDQRRLSWFRVYPTGQMLPQKYGLAQQINIPLIRSAEMVLDRAEINALASNLQDAIRDCNVTRGRAQIPLLPATLTQAALLDSIKTERIRELCFEGDRLWNLKRQRVPIPPGDRPGATNLPWDSADLVLKFSPSEMSINPYLINN